MDVHQARTVSNQEKMQAKMDIHQEKIEAAIYFIWSELEDAIKHRVEEILSCVNQKMQGLCEELTEKIGETQVVLQAVRMSHDTWTKTLADTKNNLHEEAWIMKVEIRGNEERMKAKIEATRHEFRTHLKEVEARTECGRGTGTGVGVAKPRKFWC
jgi:hypothetical protein